MEKKKKKTHKQGGVASMWKRFTSEWEIVVSTLVKFPTLLRYKKSEGFI